MSWTTGPLMGFDTETTGVAAESDRIVTAAIVDGGDVSTWLIDPGMEIPTEAVAVHGITTLRAQTDGSTPELALPEIARALTKAVEERIPVVVYRAGFDLTLLAAELHRHGIEQVPWNRLYVIDPFVLDKRWDKWRKGKRTLTAVCEHYDVPLTQAHSAVADATAAVALARAIGNRYPKVAGMNLAELHAAQMGWHADDAASLEAYLRRQGRDESVDRRWPMRF